MRTRKFYYFLVAILALNISIVGCSGDDGEIGTDGLKGEQGIQGAVGPAGADGSIIYSGEGVPASETGIEGDYYCDSATGMLYGPKKENTSWEASDSFSLSGQDGVNGTDGANGTNGTDGDNGTNGTNGTDGTNGAKILSGTGSPTYSIGNTGDYYLDKETYTLYGPAVTDDEGDTTWGLGLELKGADGNANVKTFKLTVGVSDWVEYQNTATEGYKKISYTKDFPALTKDVYDNGFILVYYMNTEDDTQHTLPTSFHNAEHDILIYDYHIKYEPRARPNEYFLVVKQKLHAYDHKVRLLELDQKEYRIKVITGQAAVQLKANKDNQIEFDRLVGELAK